MIWYLVAVSLTVMATQLNSSSVTASSCPFSPVPHLTAIRTHKLKSKKKSVAGTPEIA